MLTPRQAAAKLGVSVSLVYSWVELKLLSHYRAGTKGRGGKILIAEGDLIAFWESLKVEAAPKERQVSPPPKASQSKLTPAAYPTVTTRLQALISRTANAVWLRLRAGGQHVND